MHQRPLDAGVFVVFPVLVLGLGRRRRRGCRKSGCRSGGGRAPPRGSRFGSPLVLSRVHWVWPELVAEVKFLTWTNDNLLRQVVYEGLREDKPAREVRREVPRPEPVSDGK
jgi:ATP-dependent DNA ligase